MLTGGSAAAEDHHSFDTLTSLPLIDRPSGKEPWDLLAGSEGCIFMKGLGKNILSVYRCCAAVKGGGPWSCRSCSAEVDVKDCLKEPFGFLKNKQNKTPLPSEIAFESLLHPGLLGNIFCVERS